MINTNQAVGKKNSYKERKRPLSRTHKS